MKVNIISILKPSNRDHSVITLVIWVQGNAIDDAVSHNHQERIFNYKKKTIMQKQSINSQQEYIYKLLFLQ